MGCTSQPVHPQRNNKIHSTLRFPLRKRYPSRLEVETHGSPGQCVSFSLLDVGNGFTAYVVIIFLTITPGCYPINNAKDSCNASKRSGGLYWPQMLVFIHQHCNPSQSIFPQKLFSRGTHLALEYTAHIWVHCWVPLRPQDQLPLFLSRQKQKQKTKYLGSETTPCTNEGKGDTFAR